MKKQMVSLLAGLCLLLTGCASLLERSYSSIEPYTNRYWDTEDTLRAASYQDLVNSLLMLIEQRSGEGSIRYYVPEGADGYADAIRAQREVRRDTMLGAYLLDGISVACTAGEEYCSLNYTMRYREGTQELSTLMTLTDSQSLTDLLRIAVREEHDRITARLLSEMLRDEVLDVTDGLWIELCLDELERTSLEIPVRNVPTAGGDIVPENADATLSGKFFLRTSFEKGDIEDAMGNAAPEGSDVPEESSILFPPCPWVIRFYPDTDYPEVVEIILRQAE